VSQFSESEINYLLGERRLARIATADAEGMPHVVPVGWRYEADSGVILVSGRDFAATRKFRNVQANPQASIVIDDLASVDPWKPRGVMVEGRAEAVMGSDGHEGHIRISLDRIVSWGLDG